MLLGISISTRDVQFSKAYPPISTILSCNVTDSRLEQPLNVWLEISVTPDGITIERRLVHELKAPKPMYRVFSGKLIDSRLVQPLKAL